MSFEFIAPFWLVLLLPAILPFALWRTGKRIPDALRFLTILFVMIALAQPRIYWEQRGGTLIAVADRSRSLPPNAAESQTELINLLQRQKTSTDFIGVVAFSDHSSIEKIPDHSTFQHFRFWQSGMASNLNEAIAHATALVPPGASGKILLMSDGRFTGTHPMEAAAIAAGRSIKIDYRLMERPPDNDPAVLSMSPPLHAEPGETFQFPAEVYLPEATELEYTLYRDKLIVTTGKKKFPAGIRKFAFQDCLKQAGDHLYTLKISTDGQNDLMQENNLAQAVTSVRGMKPILIVGDKESRFASLAKAAGIPAVRAAPEQIDWSMNLLGGFGAIVLENVPASSISAMGIKSIAAFVEQTGGSLMMTGGRSSYGMGGYFASPLEPLLPVSMELRKEHRKLLMSVVIALDRSGSMTMTVPDGRQKMQLANDGTASVVNLLSRGDTIGVLAVDSQAHVIIPPTPIADDNQQAIANKIRTIQSMGGGIYIYEALNHAAQMLLKIEGGTKHIILFADAQDSEEPGNYINLLAKLRENGITVSVIGMGTKADCDAKLLQDIAKRGGGNIYFAESAMDIPQLFAQEAFSVFRNAFIESATPVLKCEDLPLVAAPSMETLPPVGGYNLTYLKPGASAGILSADENKAPIMAFWQYGCGHVMAFTNEIDGKFSGPFGASHASAELYLSALRWLNQAASKHDDPEIFVKAENKSGFAVVHLELDPDRKSQPFFGVPTLNGVLDTNELLTTEVIPFEWTDKNTLSARFQIPASGKLSLYVHATKDSAGKRKHVIPAGTFMQIYPLEFRPEIDLTRGKRTLARIAEITGGSERLGLEQILDDLEPRQKAFPLWHILAFLAMLMMILEIAWNRIGMPDKITFQWKRGRGKVKRISKTDVQAMKHYQGQAEEQKTNTLAVPVEKEEDSQGLSGLLSQAKNKGKKRF